MATREQLIKQLWPDKLLYGAIMLQLAGILGVLWGLVLLAFDIIYSPNVPEFVARYPAWATLLLSAAAALLAWLALRLQTTDLAIIGAVAGVFSLGLVGLVSVLSVASLAFLAMSKREGEDKNPRTAKLTVQDWPDKSLAASMLSLVNGVLTLGWGLALATGSLNAGSFAAQAPLLGMAAVAVALLSFGAAYLLYHQRSPGLGMASALGCLLTFGFVLLGPVLAVATLLMINQATNENEFRRSGAKERATPPPAAAAQGPRSKG